MRSVIPVRDSPVRGGHRARGSERPPEPTMPPPPPPPRPPTKKKEDPKRDVADKDTKKKEGKKKEEEEDEEDAPVLDRIKGPDERHGDRDHRGPGPGGGSADFGMALIHIGRIMMRS